MAQEARFCVSFELAEIPKCLAVSHFYVELNISPYNWMSNSINNLETNYKLPRPPSGIRNDSAGYKVSSKNVKAEVMLNAMESNLEKSIETEECLVQIAEKARKGEKERGRTGKGSAASHENSFWEVDEKDSWEGRESARSRKRGLEICINSWLRLGKAIGSGTYAICQLASYRTVTVVVKEFKSFRSGVADTERERNAAIYEANTLCTLRNHPNLPLILEFKLKSAHFVSSLIFTATRREAWRHGELPRSWSS